jgi:hypothetical protein
MSRRFIAAVLAVSTTIATLTAAPAHASNDEDIARILGAAATIFIIGKAIENSRDRDRKDDRADVYTKKNRVFDQQNSHRPVPQVVQRGVRGQHSTAALPAQCVRQITGGQVNRVVMERCLERNYRSARDLPRACKITVATNRGRTGAYKLPCLRQRGYTLARN